LNEQPNQWFNLLGEEKDLQIIKDKMLVKGNIIEFNLINGEVKNLSSLQNPNPQGGPTKSWDDMVKFDDLVKMAPRES